MITVNENLKVEALEEIERLWKTYYKTECYDEREQILKLINEQSEVYYDC